MDLEEVGQRHSPIQVSASSASELDIMNDPEYNTNVKGKEKDGEDVDTCRICRGEGSHEEPLFYPCKCSGSIKFVHQNCLMEWLAHSQKKHCELCKTPFRFTKLYHPQMPNTVPLPVFLRQAATHGWTTFMVWARFQLVLFVWVFWLPWCMRTIWRGLFWVGDGAWVGWDEHGLQNRRGLILNETTTPGNGTNPHDVYLFGVKTAAASAIFDYFSQKANESVDLYPWQGGSMSFRLARGFWNLIFGENSAHTISLPRPENSTKAIGVSPRSSTWLSDLPFLNSMTRSTNVNNIIIDTLEGQLITLFIVIAFILIFLIREWVMQQQQNMLLGPGDNEVAAGPNMDLPEQQEAVPVAAEPRPGEDGPGGNPAGEAEDGNNVRGARIFVRPRRRLNIRLPQPAEDQGEDRRPPPTAEEHNREEFEMPTENPSRFTEAPGSALETEQPILSPRMNAKGEVIQPPPELVELNLRSAVWQEILQRAQYNPEEISRIVQKELPSHERENIMQRLRTRESIAYHSASVARPLNAEAAGAADGNRDGFDTKDRNESQTDDIDEDFELLDAPTPGSSHSATSHRSLPAATNTVGPPRETVKPHDPPFGLQGSTGQVPAPSSRNTESDLISESTLRRILDEVEEADVAEDGELLSGESARTNETDSNVVPTEGGLAATASLDQGNQDANDEITDIAHEGPTSSPSLIEAVKNWLWGGVVLPAETVEQPAGDDEHIVNDIADEAPFVPVAHGHHLLQPANDDRNPGQDPEVLAAAAQAGIDPNEAEAVDEIEDLEGVMELIGMEGPLAGLMQNGMFCAVLVSLTIFFGVWIPYISGKVFLTLLASPITLLVKLLRLVSTSADMVVDFIILVLGCSLYWVDYIVNILCAPAGWFVPTLKYWMDSSATALAARSYAEHALDRFAKASLTTGHGFTDSIDVPTFSAVSHESLRQIEARLATISKTVVGSYVSLIESFLQFSSISEGIKCLSVNTLMKAKALVSYGVEKILTLAGAAPALWYINPLKFNLAGSQRSVPLDLNLAAWDAKDRAIAITSGYVFFALLGLLYLNIAGAVRGRNGRGAVNGTLAQVLYQAGGVMKVILIISIEMIAFPLYCGLLLDVALLPLFGNVTFMSRADFTMTSPWTSVFVHWFVGTCYMFHFALFVSMCRKIMRTGVLYFIRDPDDPTFHPVRDVLERSVSSQLWKISFSALVYGGLVLVCLGGVVWSIAYAFAGVFPIHWSSDEPVLEFPVDLLFYNFLMPMAVKFFKPSIGLNKVYGWWFRKCARALRLSSFLFNDTRADEEGRHVRRTWTDVFHRERGDIQNPVIGQDRQILSQDRGAQAIFLRDGKYVRTPGSDQVRVPKGATTFVEVDEDNKRKDGVSDQDEDPHGRKMNLFMKVYIPPFFRLRIAAFVGLIWLFAAATGVSVTIIPLLFGRWVFAKLTPGHLRSNDIYALSIGMYTLGGAGWALLNHHLITSYILQTLHPHTSTFRSFLHSLTTITLRLLRLFYAYSALGILLPCLISLLLEFYIIIPLHTYLLHHNSPPPATNTTTPSLLPSSPPIIHLIQHWTLGVLYVKMFARLILYTAPSRPALALRAIVARGWLDPDIRLATRAFILPATLLMTTLLIVPLSLGWAANHTLFLTWAHDDAFVRACVYRYSYPAVLALGCAGGVLWGVGKVFKGWRRRIRDEVYLIGERLHNFGEGARKGAMGRVGVGKMAVR